MTQVLLGALVLLLLYVWTQSGTREHLETTPPPPPPTDAPLSPEYAQMLNTFRDNYLQYKMTGTMAHRTAYETAQRSIEAYIAQLRTRADTNATEIQSFVDEYATANPELVALQSELRTIKEETPRLRDRYETEKRVGNVQTAVDTTLYYAKGVIVLVLAGIAFLVSLF